MVKNLHENLNEMIEENRENPEPLELDKEDVKKILSSCGVSEEKIDVLLIANDTFYTFLK